MSTKLPLCAALIAAGAIASNPVAAAPVLVSQSFALNTLLTGGSVDLNFDIGSFLATQGLSAANVVSGQVIVHGFSETNYGTTAPGAYTGYSQTGTTSHYAVGTNYVQGYSYTYSYSCGSWWHGYSTCYATSYQPGYSYQVGYTIQDNIETRYRDLLHVDNVVDQLKVTVGASSATDTAQTHSASTGSYGGNISEGSSCRSYDNYGNCSLNYLYSRERDVYEAVSGALDTSLALDFTALQDLRGDGILGSLFSAEVGQMQLQSIRFDLEVNANSAVPEPGALLLTGTALAGLVLTARRRRKP